MPEWVAIQRNPTSGAGPRAAVVRELVRELKRRGLRPRMFSKRDRLRRWLDEPRNREHLRCIVAAGGDGTVDDVINRYPGLPLAVCPLGTENLFSQFLEMPRTGAGVAKVIAGGTPRRFDLCELRATVAPGGAPGPPLRFLIMASIGFDAAVVHLTHARRSGHIRRWHYVRSILTSLRKYRYPPLKVIADGEEFAGRLVVVANLPRYALHLPVAANAVGNDGLLDVRIFERPSRWNMIRYFWNVWRNRHECLPDVRTFQAKALRIESDDPAPIQIDGDPAGFTPAEIRVLPGALTVIAPSENRAGGVSPPQG